MAFDISLTSGMRADLTSLQGTARLLNRTQQRLSSGKNVNSAVDDPSKFFAAEDHTNHASDLAARKSDMGEAIQAVKAANQGITSITTLINQARGLAQSAQSASVTNRATLAAQFNTLRTQIDQMASDSGYNGKNFLKSDSLNVLFNETGSSLLTVTGFDGTSTGLTITTASTGVEALIATHTAESLGQNFINGNSVSFAVAGKVSNVTVTQTVSVTSATWMAAVTAAAANGSSFALTHAGVASSVVIKAAISTISAAIAVGGINNQVFTLTDTMDAAATSVVVSAGAKQLVRNTDYSASFAGGKLTIKLLSATAGAIDVSYSYNHTLVAGDDYSIGSSGGPTQAATITFMKNFALATNIGADYTYKGTVDAANYTLDAADGKTKGSLLFGADVTGTVVATYATSADSLWGSDTAIQTDLTNLNNAISSLRTQASTLAANLSVITARQDWSQGIIDTLTGGADGLTLADMNEEGANMLALQTRQQLGIQALSLASQANQSVMRLFG